jgi:hypothetical protein
MPETAEVKLSSCGIEELRLWSNIPLKVAKLQLRKFFLQVAELQLQTPKKVARAHLCQLTGSIW